MMKWIYHNAFGLNYPLPVPVPTRLLWEMWKSYGYRNWKRGYRDEDCKTLMAKLAVKPQPGDVTYLTWREMNVFRAWYGQPGEKISA